MKSMFVRIHKKKSLFFFHNSNIYDAFVCGMCTKNKLQCDQTKKFFKLFSIVLFTTLSFMLHSVVQDIKSWANKKNRTMG